MNTVMTLLNSAPCPPSPLCPLLPCPETLIVVSYGLGLGMGGHGGGVGRTDRRAHQRGARRVVCWKIVANEYPADALARKMSEEK